MSAVHERCCNLNLNYFSTYSCILLFFQCSFNKYAFDIAECATCTFFFGASHCFNRRTEKIKTYHQQEKNAQLQNMQVCVCLKLCTILLSFHTTLSSPETCENGVPSEPALWQSPVLPGLPLGQESTALLFWWPLPVA